MKASHFLFASLLLGLVSSCGNSSQDISRLEAQRDSLAMANQQLSAFIGDMSTGMDSILLQQDILLRVDDSEGLTKSPKDQLEDKLDIFENLLERQKARINHLQDSIGKINDANSAKMSKILKAMQMQIAEKDQMIASLRARLEEKDIGIANLRSSVSSLSNDVQNLTEQNKAQEEVLIAQSDMMNEAYVRVGTKKELEKLGLLAGGGFLKKKKIDPSGFDAGKFDKVDIRELRNISIPGKKPKVLTQMPAGSYRIDKDGDKSSTLVILDPTAFWSVSNFLVIQY